ncbi:MarR family transcriptional regulator [Paraburkholderia sp. JPY454]|uniref:MarR family transcriptional regulator n=2 Tax=Paraburkholderia youngii TaxID=2782701 RepID=A0A7Y6K1C1_9BURK|nr:MarR family transcriptional regulator [Paraburkholderia youngii]NVI04454.1 MarR family transcriptional regulator [Paraburkholderia youngii]
MQTRSKDHLFVASVKLSESLCFAIYSANLAFVKAYRPILDELGLTYPQYVTIIALWERSPQAVGELGAKLLLKNNALTPILKRLQLMGYLDRQRDPENKRRVLISLTENGRQLREKALSADSARKMGLGLGEVLHIQEVISKLRTNLERPRQLTSRMRD